MTNWKTVKREIKITYERIQIDYASMLTERIIDKVEVDDEFNEIDFFSVINHVVSLLACEVIQKIILHKKRCKNASYEDLEMIMKDFKDQVICSIEQGYALAINEIERE